MTFIIHFYKWSESLLHKMI